MLQKYITSLGVENPKVTRSIEQAWRQTQRMAKLVESLLDVSRISVGRLTLDREDVDLAEVTAEIVERSHEEARRAGYSFEMKLPGPVVGRWDRLRLEQVITNLVSNALRYGAGRPVEIALENSDSQVRLTVRDHGVGISAEDQLRIFERFERGASTRHFGGFGLGLYIARQLTEAHGGSLSVESQVGVGSTFTLLLPRG